MKKVEVETYTATIYCGLREGYSERIHKREEVRKIAQEYCDKVGLCVTLTDLEFIYTKGNEPGVAVGLINYPRFPASKKEIRKKALTLAEILKENLKQNRVSILFPDETIMLE
jgi:hypothetical protein